MTRWLTEEVDIIKAHYDGTWDSVTECSREISRAFPCHHRTPASVYRKIRLLLEQGALRTLPVHSTLTRKNYKYAYQRELDN